jgi:hypothetical protein
MSTEPGANVDLAGIFKDEKVIVVMEPAYRTAFPGVFSIL